MPTIEQEQIKQLRAALRRVVGVSVGRSKEANAAWFHAHDVWRDTAPESHKRAALALAQKRDPSIKTLSEAFKQHGSNLLLEVENTDAAVSSDDLFEPHILIQGNPFDGYSYEGPFGDHEEALRYAQRYESDFWITPLNAPEGSA